MRWFMLGLLTATLSGCASIIPWQSPNERPDSSQLPSETTPLELPPNRAAQACLKVAQSFDQHGYEADAIVQYEKARQGKPNDLHILRRLAVLYDRQGEVGKAMPLYQQVLAQEPNNASLLNDLGYAHYRQGNWAEAESYFRKAIERESTMQRAWVNLGKTLVEQGRVDEGYEAFAQVLPAVEARSNVGVLLAHKGEIEQAKPYLRAALAQKPKLEPAQSVLAYLEQTDTGSGSRRAEKPFERAKELIEGRPQRQDKNARQKADNQRDE